MSIKFSIKGLRGRLIFVALLIGLIPMLIMFGISYSVTQSEMKKEAELQLRSIRELKKNQLISYFDVIETHIKTLAVNYSTQSAILDFTKAWNTLSSSTSPQNYLQKIYIEENPHPTGKKDLLYDAQDGSDYSRYHKRYHPFFHKTQQEFAYYDIFLFDTNGNLVYTVYKELDYATNLSSGVYSKSGLGEVFQKGIQLTEDKTVLIDFRPYEPSYGAPASFISTPVFFEGKKIGLLAFQMPLGKINEIMRNRAGHGITGESYLVGTDGLMRSDAWKDSVNFSVTTSFKKKNDQVFFSNPIFKQAVKVNSGVMQGSSYLGNSVLAAFEKIKIKQVEWVLISEINTEEAFSALYTMSSWMSITGLILLMVTFVASYVLSIKTEKPIRYSVNQLNSSMGQFEVLSGQIAQSSDQIAAGASEQASSIEQTSASISEIASSALINAEASIKANELATVLNTSAQHGHQDLKNLLQIVQQIKTGADKSSVIIKTIDEIAFQTHLLALNAAVEAARAGTMGLSFAVVADEVRSLAKKVTEAARETEVIISQSIKTAEEGKKRIDEYEKRFIAISGAAEKIVQLTTSIQQSAQEQSNATTQISLGIQETEKVIQHNAASAEEFSAASQDMIVEVQHLHKAVDILNELIKGSKN